MFGIGFQEMAFLAVIALLVFGPKRLPELARTLGRGMAEFRRASADLRGAFSLEPDPSRPAPPPRPRADEPDPLEDRDYQPRPDQTVGGPDPAAEAALAEGEARVMAELADESNDELHRTEAEEGTDPAAGTIGGEATRDPARGGRSD